MREYTHGGGWAGTPTASQHNIFDSGYTLTNFSGAPDEVRTSGLWISNPTFLPTEPPVTPGVGFFFLGWGGGGGGGC